MCFWCISDMEPGPVAGGGVVSCASIVTPPAVISISVISAYFAIFILFPLQSCGPAVYFLSPAHCRPATSPAVSAAAWQSAPSLKSPDPLAATTHHPPGVSAALNAAAAPQQRVPPATTRPPRSIAQNEAVRGGAPGHPSASKTRRLSHVAIQPTPQ